MNQMKTTSRPKLSMAFHCFYVILLETTKIIINHCGNLKFLSIIMEHFGGVNIDGNSRTSLSSASNSLQGKQHHVEIVSRAGSPVLLTWYTFYVLSVFLCVFK